MTLKRDGKKFEVDLASWHFALELGRRYGWLPAGTEPPDDLEEGGGDAEPGEGAADLLEGDDDEDDEDEEDIFEEDGEEDDEDDEDGAPLCDGWPWDYVDNAGRKVTEEDARLWADALEQALPDIPDHCATDHKPAAYPMPAAMAPLLRDMAGDDLPDPSQFVNALEWFSGARKQGLRDLIDFCRQGGFAVW
jgi:hypothetical protein